MRPFFRNFPDPTGSSPRRIGNALILGLVICHGGPFDEPEAVGEALARMPGVHGFYGATSMERLPVERGIIEQVRKFTEIKTAPLKKKSLPSSKKL